MGAKLYNTKQGFRDGSYVPPTGETLNPAQYQLERERWARSLDDATVRSLAYDYLQGVEMEDTLDAYMELKRRWPNSRYGEKRDSRRTASPVRAPRAPQPIATGIKLCDTHVEDPDSYTSECGACRPIVAGFREGQSLRRQGSAIADRSLDDEGAIGEAITDTPDLLPEAVMHAIADHARDDQSA